jgi:hypothetical protein
VRGSRKRTFAQRRVDAHGRVLDVQVRGATFSIGRGESNDLVSDSAHLSGMHCALAPAQGTSGGALVLTDSSTNGTFVDGSRVCKGSMPLRWGQRVELVKGHKGLCFVVREFRGEAASQGFARNKTLVSDPNDETLSDKGEGEAEGGSGSAREGGGSARGGTGSAKKKDAVSEHMKCGICLEVLHRAVTLLPCQHNFCAGCYSECMQRSSTCPQCRGHVEEVSRNHTLCNIITAFLDANPHLQRAPADRAELDSKDRLPDEALRARKRHRPAEEDGSEEDWSEEDLSEEDDDEDLLDVDECYNCSHDAPDGYRCSVHGAHRACSLCFSVFPAFAPAAVSAANSRPPAECSGCGRATCGPYYAWMGREVLLEDRIVQKCWALPVRLDQLHFPLPDLPDEVFQWNAVERAIVLECMHSAGLSPSQLFQHCLQELRAGRLQCADALGPADGRGLNVTGITSIATAAQAGDVHLCRCCVPKLFAGMVYAWRAALPADSLPPTVTSFSGGHEADTRTPPSPSPTNSTRPAVGTQNLTASRPPSRRFPLPPLPSPIPPFLLLHFLLPPLAGVTRDDCWYGSSCRTQVGEERDRD